ncbi:hypothetical protein P9139_14880 [Curtobacterium flaccumfaciens]|nr:hypothetical protein P9139_14880 [Curtobacterium flaccumfaciens]
MAAGVLAVVLVSIIGSVQNGVGGVFPGRRRRSTGSTTLRTRSPASGGSRTRSR